MNPETSRFLAWCFAFAGVIVYLSVVVSIGRGLKRRREHDEAARKLRDETALSHRELPVRCICLACRSWRAELISTRRAAR